MSKQYNEVVRVYEDCLDLNGRGDFVRCTDCGLLQLIQIGGTSCGCDICQSENLQWYTDETGNEIQEITITELEQMGFIIEDCVIPMF